MHEIRWKLKLNTLGASWNRKDNLGSIKEVQ
jgi:hypothetical protein